MRDAALPVPKSDIDARTDALIDLIVGKYAPMPNASLGQLVAYLGNGVPQWKDARKLALARARAAAAAGTGGWRGLGLAC